MIGYIETYSPVGTSAGTPGRGLAEFLLFQRYDTDGDGTLSEQEATEAGKNSAKLRDRPELMKRLFERLDKDSDQKITPEEFSVFREFLDNSRPSLTVHTSEESVVSFC